MDRNGPSVAGTAQGAPRHPATGRITAGVPSVMGDALPAATGKVVSRRRRTAHPPYLLSTCSTARKASCGISTRPTCFIRFLPSFCFSRSFFLREMSPP